jgi:hypothetical protein
MESFDSYSQIGSNRGSTSVVGHSISHGVSKFRSDYPSESGTACSNDVRTPSSSEYVLYYGSIKISDDGDISDLERIARGIFSTELRDVLIVLKNCGALGTLAKHDWCIGVLLRLLDELGSDDMA